MTTDQQIIFDRVLKGVSAVMNVQPSILLGGSKVRHVVQARKLAAYILKEMGWTETDIGDALKRDRSTVYNLIAGGSRLITSDDRLYKTMRSIEARARRTEESGHEAILSLLEVWREGLSANGRDSLSSADLELLAQRIDALFGP